MDKQDEEWEPLTSQELECLAWVGRGKTSGDISSILSISQQTVRSHCATAIAKLSAQNLMHAVAKAHRLNLI